MKLRIAEDTACIPSKISYMDEDGLDKNGIYYFGKKPDTPKNWKDALKVRNLTDEESKIYEEWLHYESIDTGETLEGLLNDHKQRVLEYENDKNSHYFYVMAWEDKERMNAPVCKKKFDIYEDAVNFYNKCYQKYMPDGFVRMFEYIGGRRKMIANSEEGKL